MPITITITDPTPDQIAALFGVTLPSRNPNTDVGGSDHRETIEVKPTRQPRKAKPDAGVKGDTPITPEIVSGETLDPEDAQLAAEMAADIADAEPEPPAATAVVDAGTGKPLVPQAVDIAEVRANATRLAQKDTPALAALLKQFGAAKLSEVGEGELPSFNAAVVAALG